MVVVPPPLCLARPEVTQLLPWPSPSPPHPSPPQTVRSPHWGHLHLASCHTRSPRAKRGPAPGGRGLGRVPAWLPSHARHGLSRRLPSSAWTYFLAHKVMEVTPATVTVARVWSLQTGLGQDEKRHRPSPLCGHPSVTRTHCSLPQSSAAVPGTSGVNGELERNVTSWVPCPPIY